MAEELCHTCGDDVTHVRHLDTGLHNYCAGSDVIDFHQLPFQRRLVLDTHRNQDIIESIEAMALAHLGEHDPDGSEHSKWRAFDAIRFIMGGSNDLTFDLDMAACHHEAEGCDFDPEAHQAMVEGNFVFKRVLDWTGEFYCVVSVLTDKGLLIWPEDDDIIQVHSWW